MQSQRNELPGGFGRGGLKRLPDRFVIYVPCQTIRAEQKHVAFKQVESSHIRRDGFLDSYCPSQDMRIWMRLSLLSREGARFHLLLHERMITGEPFQFRVSETVNARITHLNGYRRVLTQSESA